MKPSYPRPVQTVHAARHVGHAYRRHFANHRRERAFLSATSFTTAFAGCRIVTHAIRADRGPFKNMSAGGHHLHHSTPGILTLILIGDVWVYRFGFGPASGSTAGSRAAVIAYGVASALTLDEFALWFDLEDDYWNAAGRKSIDAAVLFGGVSIMGAAGHGLLRELRRGIRAARRELRPDEAGEQDSQPPNDPTPLDGAPENHSL